MKCLKGYPDDLDLMVSMDALKILVDKLSYSRSVDGFLTKFTVFVVRLEELFKDYIKVRVVFEKILACEELSEYLGVLALYRDDVEKMVFTNPRFKPLRRYADILLAVLDHVQPVEKALSVTRPPIHIIKHGDTHTLTAGEASSPQEESERFPPVVAKRMRAEGYGARYSLKKLAMFIAIILLLLLAAYLAIHLMPELTSYINSSSPTSYISPSLGEKLFEGDEKLFNVSVLTTVRDAVFGSFLPSDSTETTWWVLEWAAKNIAYGKAHPTETVKLCKRSVCYPGQSPLSTLSNKVGVCIDYALLIASALLSVNISPVYIIVFDSLDHAVAATIIDNTVFILDQRPPPIEFGDYLSYIANNVTYTSPIPPGTVFELKIESQYVIYRTSTIPLSLQERYHEDSLPKPAIDEIMKLVAGSTGLRQSMNALHNPRMIVSITIGVPKIGESRGIEEWEVTHPLWRLYTTTFHKYWVNYLAQYILDMLANVLKEENYSYIWIKVEENHIVIYLW